MTEKFYKELKGKKILVLDNQYSEYETICNRLPSDYCEVFPSPKEFMTVIDWVRIVLNTRYELKKTKKATENLITYIQSVNPDLFIIDYKISGSHDGRTGIDLAVILWDKTNFPEIPILFLTRAATDDEKLMNGKSEFDSNFPSAKTACNWVNKGYGGLDKSPATYFNKHVLSKICKLISETWLEKFGEKIAKLKRRGDYDKFWGLLDEILDQVNLTNKIEPLTRQVIDDLCKKPIRDEEEIRKLLNSIKPKK